MNPSAPNRREFLQAGAAGLAAAGITGAAPADDKANSGGIPLRPLGKTGEMVSAIGLGGHSATNPQKLSEKESLALIQRAVDEGITFMDNCWDYHDGVAEERMGKALAEGGRRDKVFLMTKVCGRTAKEAPVEPGGQPPAAQDRPPRPLAVPRDGLRQRPRLGLRRGRRDPRRAQGPEGRQGPLPRASPATRTRSIHLKMLGKPFDWAAVQMPLNVMDAHYRSFQKQVLPVARQARHRRPRR